VYATCLFCHAHLGRNEVVEPFPVGRRLAFDAARGRLWVVCPACARWNLSPVEERWEAVEECERRFRDTRARVSTDNIGLARLREGLDLVRVGPALRPEYAAWRYGGELARRRTRDHRNAVLSIGGLVGTMVGGAAAASLLTPLAALAPVLYVGGAVAYYQRQERRLVARIPGPDQLPVPVQLRDLHAMRFGAGGFGGLAVRVRPLGVPLTVAGDAAERLASIAIARRNEMGATRAALDLALARFDAAGGSEGTVAQAARAGTLSAMRYTERLALEMALHEESERRAMDGELAALEAAWRDAEEIAAIADDLLLPEPVRRALGHPSRVPRAARDDVTLGRTTH
jgi:hypothetical protein